MKTFIPFHELNDRDAIIVDGAHKQGLVLSHWRGQNTQPGIADDTSGAIVLNAIEKKIPGLDRELVTATHFDIDGLVGVWSLFYPGEAMRKKNILDAVARIGDFREVDFSKPGEDEAMKIVCWIDAEERNRFYRPFGEFHEMEACMEKFRWFIPHFGDAVMHIDNYRTTWEKDFQKIKNDYAVIHGTQTSVKKYEATGLVVVHTPQPVNYYALFSITKGSDIVLSVYGNNRYELEYKYTTWVDIVSRPTLPRIPLQPLCDKLNALEKTGNKWCCDPVTDSGPLLRLEDTTLSKEERFAHPTERIIHSSSVSPEDFEMIVVNFFSDAYRNITPKKNWTWKEIRDAGKTGG